jgi:hypothetical protein
VAMAIISTLRSGRRPRIGTSRSMGPRAAGEGG